MATIYTLNGKVLKNSANDKWLVKKPEPEPETYKLDSTTLEGYGYGMGSGYIGGIWRGPEYPNRYNGYGHKLRITVRNNITLGLPGDGPKQIAGWYLATTAAGYVSAGPSFILATYFISNSDANIPVGVYEFDLEDYNDDTADYGKYIFLVFGKATTSTAGYTQVTTMETLMNNVTMEIV